MPTQRAVSFSNPKKVYFPSGFTKGEMIQYYIEIAAAMVPHLRDRPITLIRFPNGVKGQSFYEKNAAKHRPAWIETFGVSRGQDDGEINYILVNHPETLAWCANLGAIEFHPFLHRALALNQPTHLAFDLDPGEGSNLLTCVEVAHLVQGILSQLGLQSFPKVSGSKGIQLYVPLNGPATYDAVTPFAKSIAELLAQQHPRLVVSEMPKALRKGRVMIDWSQNVQAKTTVAVYSMRGKRDEPYISAPVTWAELDRAANSRDVAMLNFSPAEVLRRFKALGDLFAPVLTLRQELPDLFMKLGPSKSAYRSWRPHARRRDAARVAEPSPQRLNPSRATLNLGAAELSTSDTDLPRPGNPDSAPHVRKRAKQNGQVTAAAATPKRRIEFAANVTPSGRAPLFVEPMKPQLVTELPDGAEWIYEVKWDGYRALLLKHGDEVQLLSRNEKSLAKEFPGIVAAARALPGSSFLIDGEVVALDAKGKSAFQELQNRSSTKAAIVFYAFDLLALEGKDLRRLPLLQRKALLVPLVEGTVLRLSPGLPGSASQVLAAIGQLGLEGVIAKRSNSPYISGDGSTAWQKLRLRQGQEFVVGGYRPGMQPFESVLVGYYEGKNLIFAGKVRPGFTPRTRQQVWDLIKGDQVPGCPFSNLPDADKKGRWGEGITLTEMATLRWVKPKIVVQIEFVEWTSNAHLRHAAFTGIRPDKKAINVTREIPAE